MKHFDDSPLHLFLKMVVRGGGVGRENKAKSPDQIQYGEREVSIKGISLTLLLFFPISKVLFIPIFLHNSGQSWIASL